MDARSTPAASFATRSIGPSPIAQYATVPRAFVFIQRINLGLYALLGDLGARGNYRRLAEEVWPFVNRAPSTELGEREAPWWATRGPGRERRAGSVAAHASCRSPYPCRRPRACRLRR